MFYSKLNKSHISDADYKHALNVWNKLNCKKFKDYHDLHLHCAVLLWANGLENFRNVCYDAYGLHYHYFGMHF